MMSGRKRQSASQARKSEPMLCPMSVQRGHVEALYPATPMQEDEVDTARLDLQAEAG
eukprot:CAMPEP_0170639088 /NCGR_PEP_ID=MMETSP0224-20130122/39439_1 /TAXON_ID=285029 /ORGANISM="Togula jolla, Strain CCCM 725" /LENGTH=56 /DNA_ID=CAMNT_0010969373 /DNA_START=533 /DNA_END=698 /DNA_ORIENTATION=+